MNAVEYVEEIGDVQNQVGVANLADLLDMDSSDEEDVWPPRKKRRVDLERKHWFLTWNNPPADGKDILMALGAEKYVFQMERGKKGTPHWQGVFSFMRTKRWSILDNACSHDAVWLPCISVKAARVYCSKVRSSLGETYCKGYVIPEELIDPLAGKELYDWQSEILQLCTGVADERKVYWYWSEAGDIGKSALCKHMCLTLERCFVMGGRFKDSMYAIAKMVNEKLQPPKVIIFDVPRSMQKDGYPMVSYHVMEKIKDGCFFSPKYESEMVLFNPCHVIVFANLPPNRTQLSRDRWQVKCLDE